MVSVPPSSNQPTMLFFRRHWVMFGGVAGAMVLFLAYLVILGAESKGDLSACGQHDDARQLTCFQEHSFAYGITRTVSLACQSFEAAERADRVTACMAERGYKRTATRAVQRYRGTGQVPCEGHDYERYSTCYEPVDTLATLKRAF